MNDVIRAIKERRSVREFTKEQVCESHLQSILEAACYAPSGTNNQSWLFTAVQNSMALERLNSAVREAFANLIIDEFTYKAKKNGKVAAQRDTYTFYFHAPTVIIVSNVRGYPNGMADCATALQNMFLAAHSLGLASCWVNQLFWLGDTPEVGKALLELGIPSDHCICGAAAIGHPVGKNPEAPARKGGTVRVVR